MELRWKLIVVVVLLFSLGSLYLIEDRFVGDVVWELTTVVDNCSDADIAALWDEVFVESFSEITIFKESGGNCDKFIAYKIKDMEEYYFMNYSWGNIIFVWANLTSEGISEIRDLQQDYATFVNFSQDIRKVNNWSEATANVTHASWQFSEIFRITLPAFQEVDLFGFIIFYLFEEIEINKSHRGLVNQNESIIGYSYSNDPLLGGSSTPAFIEDIANFTFEKNSSWNYAFDLADYFGLEDGVNVGFSYWGVNNTGGEWINYSIINGAAQFKPAVGFIGSREFRLSAMNDKGTIESNNFTVTIVENINDAPVFAGKIEDVILKRTMNVTIYLDDYFSDPDGTTLNYSITGRDNVSVAFDGDDMYVWLKSGFTDFERFRIVASDRVYTVQSNWITVFLGNNNSISGEDPLTGLLNDSLLVSPGSLSALGTSTNDSDSDDSEGGGVVFWIMVVSRILLVVLIICVVIYFAFFDKRPVQMPVVNTVVNDYLKKINSMKDNGRY